VALKKSDLYASLWASCDELRNAMEPAQYKNYVLVMLFIKYVSDKYAGTPYAPITVPKGSSFEDLVKLKGSADIGDKINKKIIAPLAAANKLPVSDMPDFNDASLLGTGKEMVERITNLIAIFEDPRLDFSKNRADGDDILGDAYEYLMRHFATASGKSKGQFYTPAEVSRIMARLIGISTSKVSNDTTVYDPTCGSGSLLLKVGEEAAQGKNIKVTLYGQEMETTTAGLARMNMILHDTPTAEIAQGNTLTTPKFKDKNDKLKTFDFVVANPPFSDKRWSTGLDPEKDVFERFKHFGVPPKKQGDYAYLLHIVRSLKETGKGACILPHGVLFRGNAESVIRKNLVTRGYIKAIIGLPANLFYGTGIPACIIVTDKEHAVSRKGIFMIDASKGFIKDGSKNRLREQDVHRIIDVFNKQSDVPGFARMVSLTEISGPKNDFNLNLPRYIASIEEEDLQNIDAHLHGGIPDRDIDLLESFWQVLPNLRKVLFADGTRDGFNRLNIAGSETKAAIFDNAEFTSYQATVNKLFEKWCKTNRPHLEGFKQGDKPKALLSSIAEDLLTSFKAASLIDGYDVYQHLMNYWSETMQDDVYMVSADGWLAGAKPRQVEQRKNKDGKMVWAEEHDYLVGKQRFKSDLIPRNILIDRFFASQQKNIDDLQAELSIVEQEIDEQKEEHAVEGGLLEDVNEGDEGKVKITAKKLASWLKENSKDPEYADAVATAKAYQKLLTSQSDVKTKIKQAEEDLDVLLCAKYGALTETEVKSLVVDDKWIATLKSSVESELNRVSQTLTSRIGVLADRYVASLPSLTDEVGSISARVDEHLKKMGKT
jgi:type I restriction enzyme M protein